MQEHDGTRLAPQAPRLWNGAEIFGHHSGLAWIVVLQMEIVGKQH